MPVLRIPTPLRSYTKGLSEVHVAGTTVGEAMLNFVEQYPTMQPHLYNRRGELRPFVNLFLAENNIRDLQGLSTPLKNDDRILLIPSIAGG